jgi:hypothetical protein
MKRKFNDTDLMLLCDHFNSGGPRAAYRAWYAITDETPIATQDVEYFSGLFMTEYNNRFGVTF